MQLCRRERGAQVHPSAHALPGRARTPLLSRAALLGRTRAFTRSFLDSIGCTTTKILAKIETRQALLNLNGILKEADGIIMSRGGGWGGVGVCVFVCLWGRGVTSCAWARVALGRRGRIRPGARCVARASTAHLPVRTGAH